MEASEDGLRVLVSVPPGVQVDLDGVTAKLADDELDASATAASEGASVKRTTVLAIDTSESMRSRGRFEAAKEAAGIYLTTVPDDVEVGIVTFDNEVNLALDPTTDRAAAQAVIDGLETARDTRLHDGVLAAIDAAGTLGQRTVLLLSDGADTGGGATIGDVVDGIDDSKATVDVVSLGVRGTALEALREMAGAGESPGTVINSTGEGLADAFRAEADLLASQILVTAPLPSGFDAEQANVEVTLPTDGEPIVAAALASIQSASGDADLIDSSPEVADQSAWDAPDWVLYGGLVAFAIGLVVVALMLVPAKPAPMTLADRVEAYSTRASVSLDKAAARPATEPVLEQAKAAAAGVLERNRGLNDRLTRRLSAAGSEFKPSEWLLLHVGLVFAFGLLGLLVGKGDLVVGILFMAIGVVAPPIYLRIQSARRLKAFQKGLPDVLQLISGALSAGLSLAQAVDTVVREGPEPIASEFKRVLVESRIGVPLEDAFEGVAARFQSKDFAWTVMAIRIQRQVGGNLAELLTTVAATMRERASLRRHVSALAAEGRMSAYVLCGLPPGFFMYLFLTNRDFLEPLYADPRGWIISGLAVGWLLIGVFWMSRLVKVEA
ncbi:type II secretion system F family protein [Nocardioides caeni]|uniref:type II secretion system F family protein n=1 Tax=Nocardioides caeni TaxID=574700 RepID=UPI0031E6306E